MVLREGSYLPIRLLNQRRKEDQIVELSKPSLNQVKKVQKELYSVINPLFTSAKRLRSDIKDSLNEESYSTLSNAKWAIEQEGYPSFYYFVAGYLMNYIQDSLLISIRLKRVAYLQEHKGYSITHRQMVAMLTDVMNCIERTHGNIAELDELYTKHREGWQSLKVTNQSKYVATELKETIDKTYAKLHRIFAEVETLVSDIGERYLDGAIEVK